MRGNKIAEGGDGTTIVAVGGQTVDHGSFEQKRHDLRFMEDTRIDQLAVHLQIIGRQRRFIFVETAGRFRPSDPRDYQSLSPRRAAHAPPLQGKREVPEGGFQRSRYRQ